MNNSKKYLVIALSILFILVIGIFFIQSLLKSKPESSSITSPFPTAVQVDKRYSSSLSSSSSSNSSFVEEDREQKARKEAEQKTEQEAQQTLKEVQSSLSLPLEEEDFILDYAPNLSKLVVTRKTPQADASFAKWAKTQGYPRLVDNIKTTIISDKTMEEVQTPYVTKSPEQGLTDLFTLFGLMIRPPVMVTGGVTPRVTEKPKSSSSSSSPKSYGGYIYYPQCDGPYDDYPLTESCSICRGGCGPTTVAMILSSFIDTKYTPPEVVDIYKSVGGAGCGTGLGVAKGTLSSHGVKTSDYILPYSATKYIAEDVIDDFRSYLDNGWTIFALASYCEAGCGHYFWITDIDEEGNIYAFDPYYGTNSTPPINENSRYPFPKYIAAFGVKK